MTANEILRELDLSIGSASKADVRRLWHAADDGGTVPAEEMMKVFGRSRPERHTTCSLRIALQFAGCQDE